MKKNLLVLSASVLGAAVLGFAQNAPAPASEAPAAPRPTKVATLFIQNAILSTREGQQANLAITTRFAPTREKFDKQQAAIQAITDQLKKGAATMSAPARQKLELDLNAKQTELKRNMEDAQAELDQVEGKMLQDLGVKLTEVVQQFAQERGYAVVLDVSNQMSPVFWAAPGIDITSEIVKRYDQTYPGAPATPAAGAAQPPAAPVASPAAPPPAPALKQQ